MALIGYRRVSTYDQKLDRQDLGDIDQLFEEKESGSDRTRPALREMLTYVRAGDEVLVWSIDRLARDFRDLQDIVTQITDKGAGIKFLSEGLAFKSGGDDPFAKLQLHMMGAFAEFELALIRKRQADGIAKAQKRGVYKGGKRRIDREKVVALRTEGLGPSAIAEQMGVSRMSIYRILSEPTAG
ncbi:recombinase family protein [Shimia gijangensis]|uniref:recombinase family protein n=1 Tax=Shimia gijangensis TaxID=1470563 RepID=UPI0009FB08E8|nr:recombinase family protein [Shimia gijangensis]